MASAPRMELRVQPASAGAGAAAVLSLQSPAALVVESVRLTLVGRTVFHSSWVEVPAGIPAELRLSGAGRDVSVRICASEPAEVLTDVTLHPGEVHTVWFEVALPRDAPPSYNGTAIKHAYTITANAKVRGVAQEVSVVQPVRVALPPQLGRGARGEMPEDEAAGCFVSHRYDASTPPLACRWERGVMQGLSAGLIEAGLAATAIWSPTIDATWAVAGHGGVDVGDPAGTAAAGWRVAGDDGGSARDSGSGAPRHESFKINVAGEHVVTLSLRDGATVGCGGSLILDLDFGTQDFENFSGSSLAWRSMCEHALQKQGGRYRWSELFVYAAGGAVRRCLMVNTSLESREQVCAACARSSRKAQFTQRCTEVRLPVPLQPVPLYLPTSSSMLANQLSVRRYGNPSFGFSRTVHLTAQCLLIALPQVSEVVLCAQQVRCALPVPLECTPSFRSDLLSLEWRIVLEMTLAPQDTQAQAISTTAPQTVKWELPVQIVSGFAEGAGGAQHAWPQELPPRRAGLPLYSW